MNLTLRIRTSQRTFILKQSRAWVEKYPAIAAPEDRICVEHAFYEETASNPQLACRMPRVLQFSSAARVLMLEDLGEARDCTDLYGAKTITDEERGLLLEWLGALHEQPVSSDPSRFRNREMRKLNHEHIFDLPLRPGVLNADGFYQGLGPVAERLRSDAGLVKVIKSLGEIYLQDGGSLLHGDYYPGSWVRTSQGLRILDPEFCFLGCREFDFGVMLAHLVLGGANFQEESDRFRKPVQAKLDWRLVVGFAAAEVIRRLMGVAQLPLEMDLRARTGLLEQARTWVLN